MYEYNIDDYFKFDEEEQKHDNDEKIKKNIENINSIVNNNSNKNNEQINHFIRELYYNLISLKNNYNQKSGEKIINYTSKIKSLIILIIFESIRYIRELLLNFLTNIGNLYEPKNHFLYILIYHLILFHLFYDIKHILDDY